MSIVVKAFCREPSETRLTRGKSEQAGVAIVVERLPAVVVRAVHRHGLMAEQELQEAHSPSFPCRDSSSRSSRSMVSVVCWCCRRSGPSWFRRSRLLASIDSWFIATLQFALKLVELEVDVADLLGDVLVVGGQVPGRRETADLHGEPQVHELVQQLSALEHGKDAGCMNIQMVIRWHLRKDAYPCVELSQGELFTGQVDDKLWNFQGTLLSGVDPNIRLHTHKEKPTR